MVWARPDAVDASQDFRFIKIDDFTVPLYTHALPAQPAEPVNAELVEATNELVSILKDWHEEFPEHVGHKELPAIAAVQAALSRAQAAPEVGVPVFPERIMRQLTIMADRVGDEFHGPWEDGDGEPLQDDAEAAIAWIASAQPQQKEG